MSKLFETDEVKKGAWISECGKYRYWLSRQWDDSIPFLTFIMLNPSTADASIDDPTIRRCMGFAKRDGYGGICVANLFAFRATDPKELLTAADPIGPHNPVNTMMATHGSTNDPHHVMLPIVLAWGAHKFAKDRAKDVITGLHSCELLCLGKTKDGHPRHPLYVPADQPLVPWRVEK